MSNASRNRSCFSSPCAPTLPLLLALAACGQRYELGEVLEPLGQGLPTASPAAGSVLIDHLADADVELPRSVVEAQPVGDVDGDGKDDWITRNAPLVPGRGGFRLIYGGERSADGQFPEERMGPVFGWAAPFASGAFNVDAAGDVDADGYADLLVSTFLTFDEQRGGGYDGLNSMFAAAAYEQRAYLVYGGPRALTATIDLGSDAASFDPLTQLRESFSPALRQESDPGADEFHILQRLALAPLGDIDDDGFDDFSYTYVLEWTGMRVRSATGTQLPATTHAVTHVFYGGPARLAPGAALGARAAELEGAWSVEALGDIDGDGLAEFAAQQGRERYIVHGSPQRLTGRLAVAEAGALLVTASEPAEVGDVAPRVHAAGDLDGDGFGDVLLERWASTTSHTAFLFYGSDTLLAEPLRDDRAEAAFQLRAGLSALDNLGDWNDDGYGDLFGGGSRVPSEDSLEQDHFRSAVVIFPGGVARYAGVYVTPLANPELDLTDTGLLTQLGVYPIGDVDGDGRADVMMDARTPDAEGGTFIKFGGPISTGTPLH